MLPTASLTQNAGVLPRHSCCLPDVGVVALRFHSQQGAQIMVGVLTRVAGLSFEAPKVTLPKVVQLLRQLLTEFRCQTPTLWMVNWKSFVGQVASMLFSISLPIG